MGQVAQTGVIMDTNKLNKLSIKNFIKNSTPSRLQSLRLPRDLSLGGTKIQQKKVYKPNVNVVRNKNKTEKAKSNEKSKSKPVKEKQEKMKDKFIQSTGVFSEGIGPNLGKQIKLEKKLTIRETKPSRNLDFPDFAKQSIKKATKNIQDLVPNDLKIDKSDSDSEDKLPFAPSTWDSNFLGVKSETKEWSNKLPIEYGNSTDSTNSVLTLWQLPDSFTNRGIKLSDFHLPEMPEGQIGKLVVHKSGKFEVSIANTNFLLDSTLDSFSEDVVCLNIDTKNSFVLGEVKNRFILSPDWSFLL